MLFFCFCFLHGINIHIFWDTAVYFGKLGRDAAVVDPALCIVRLISIVLHFYA